MEWHRTAVIALLACAAEPAPEPEWIRRDAGAETVHVTGADLGLAPALLADLAAGRLRATDILALGFDPPVPLWVYPDRGSLTRHWRIAWQRPDLVPECWMIAAGWASELNLLSPAAWPGEACGHPAGDALYRRMVIGHELVHALHAQQNATYPQLDATMPWLNEGLAVYVSGQLEAVYQPGGLLARGLARNPQSIAELWALPENYALMGSLIRYLDQSRGRPILRALLQVDSPAQFLDLVGVGEAELLAAWKAAER
jgi:hypothetical protein